MLQVIDPETCEAFEYIDYRKVHPPVTSDPAGRADDLAARWAAYQRDTPNPVSVTPVFDMSQRAFWSFDNRNLLALIGFTSDQTARHKAVRASMAYDRDATETSYITLGFARSVVHGQIAAAMEATLTSGIWARSTAAYGRATAYADRAVRNHVLALLESEGAGWHPLTVGSLIADAVNHANGESQFATIKDRQDVSRATQLNGGLIEVTDAVGSTIIGRPNDVIAWLDAGLGDD